jgi:hypothetical protein
VVSADPKNETGAAYVFAPSGTGWSQQAELTASDGAAGDHFSFSVAISGSTAVIGAPLKNSQTGAAYVFVLPSMHWSGYVAYLGTYHSVSASWTEPAGQCAAGHQESSFWVGLDGYNSDTVEQTGSEVDCIGGSPQYFAWYEMYPMKPVSFPDTVRPGDQLTGSVTYNGGSSYTLVLTDTTQHWSHTVPQILSGAANTSAEVIAEANSTASGRILPLTNFGTVNFANASVDGAPIGDTDPAELTMVNGAGLAKVAVSPLSGGQNFSVTWERST